MSIIRLGLLAGLVIMLLPTDERRQSELSGAASQTAQRTVTFCERNPSTCEAGREMWALFLRKAEFGMELAARLVREQLARSAEPAPVPAAASMPIAAPARAPARTPTSHLAHPAPRDFAPAPAAGGVRIEPIDRRGATADRAPQWRAPQAARTQL